MFNGANFGVKGHCHWLPFGVDTEIFKKAECSVCHGTSSPLEYIPCGRCRGEGAEGEPEDRDIALGFVGSMYPKRAHYVKALSNHLKGIPLIGSVIVEDIDGVQYRETAERLATNYRRIKIFLNLPSESRLLVSKVYEVMACGTFLMTPGLNQDAQENMGQFVDGRDIVFYKPSNLPYLAQMINEFVSNDAKRDAIAAAGYKEVRENHSLVKRMEKVLEVMK
jgi:spore maturation protein CgeB